LAVDAQGNLWYADESKVVIAQLDPNTNLLTSYVIPNGISPRMVSIHSGFIWYTTEQTLSNIGRLDPLVAVHTVFTPSIQSPTVNPVCNPITPSSTGTITPSTGNMFWNATSYPSLLNTGGWKIYQTPVGSITWGIAVPTLGYVVDSGRQELIRFTPPTTLIVIKHVINNNGGTAIAGDFTMSVNNPGATPPTLPGAESPGTEVIVDPGDYSVSESGPSGYTASYSADCTGSMTIEQTKTCTVTNDDIAPVLHLRKTLTNDNGGTALATDWTLAAAGPTSLSGTTPVDSGASFTAGTYTLSESGGPAGYTASSWSCVKNGGAPVISDGITLGLGDDATCTITNDDIPPKIYLPMIRR
jgi:hypothetical protein